MNRDGVEGVLKRLGIKVVDELNGWVRSVCPFGLWKHDGGVAENPNFGVTHDDDEPSYYNCLVCGSKGHLSGLPIALAHARKSDMDRARAFAKEIEKDEILGGTTDFGEWDDEESVAEKTADEDLRIRSFPDRHEFLKHPPAVGEPDALRYLASRNIHFDTVTKLGLRYDIKNERVLFPLIDYWTGRYIGHSGRVIWSEAKRAREEELATERSLARGGKRVKIPKVRDYAGLEKRKAFLGTYGRNDRRIGTPEQPPYWILCEGLLAYARFVQLGFGHCTLGILGSTMTEAKAEIIKDSGRSVYHFSDPDQGGSKYLYGSLDDEGVHRGNGALDRLYGEVVQFVPQWPDFIQDPDDFTNPQQVIDMMQSAELYARSLTPTNQKTSFGW